MKTTSIKKYRFITRNSIITELFIILTIVIIGEGATFYSESLLGKYLGPEAYGDFRVTVGALALISQCLLFGFDVVSTKYLPKFLKNNEYTKAKNFIAVIAKIIAIPVIGWFILGSVIAILVAISIKQGNSLVMNLHVDMLYLEFAGLLSIFWLLLKVLRSLGKTITSAILYQANSLLMIAFITYKKPLITVHYAIAAILISYTLSILIGLILISLKFSSIQNIKHKLNLNQLINDAFLFMIQQVISYSIANILIFLAEILPISDKNVGILSSSLTIANLLLIPFYVIKTTFQTRISSIMDAPATRIKTILNKISIISLVLMLASAIFLYLIAPYILDFYGQEFIEVKPLLPFAIIANLPLCITMGNSSFLNYDSKGNIAYTYIIFINLVVLVTLGICFILLYGIKGALIAYFISQVFLAILTIKYRNQILSQAR